jgi:DNA-binding transcriptional regulator YiaG
MELGSKSLVLDFAITGTGSVVNVNQRMPKPKENAAIRRFYREGQRASAKAEKLFKSEHRVWGALEKSGAETLSQKNRLMEAKKFARLVYAKELNYLCRVYAKGWMFTRPHVLQLMRVHDVERRRELEKRCVSCKWSIRQLQREIDQLGLHRSYGGTPRPSPESVDEALVETEVLLRRFLSWHKQLRAAKQKSIKRRGAAPIKTKQRASSERLSPRINKELEKLSQNIQAVWQLIKDELDRRSKISSRQKSAASTVKATRRRMRLSMAEFARLVGVTSSTIRNWESGASRPRLRYLEKLTSLRRRGRK